jgi:hypothetical protein
MILLDTLANVIGDALLYTVAAKDISAPGGSDGTGLQATWLTDLWGFIQACTKKGSVVPNGSNETADASQIYEGLEKALSPPGTVLQGMWNDDPSVLNYRVLPLEGQGVLVADYPELTTACYVGDADNATAGAFFRANDAAGIGRSISGTYLILPDTRGSFLRDNDSAKTYDPYGDRTMGEVQGKYLQDHEHNVMWDSGVEQQLYRTSYTTDTSTGPTQPHITEAFTAGNEIYGWNIQATNKSSAGVSFEASDLAPRNAICRFAIRY